MVSLLQDTNLVAVWHTDKIYISTEDGKQIDEHETGSKTYLLDICCSIIIWRGTRYISGWHTIAATRKLRTQLLYADVCINEA